jgi:hypothetical protein
MRLRTLVVVVSGLLLVVGAVPAQANILPTLVSITPSAGGFMWTYDVQVTEDQKTSGSGAVPGPGIVPADDTRSIKDFITWYDFGGFTGTVVVPAGWDDLSFAVGSTPTRSNPDQDLATFPNITVYRAIDVGTPGPFTFQVGIESLFNLQLLGHFASDATKHAPGELTNNTGVANAGRTITPFRVAQVPEPGTLLLMGAGLLGLGIYRRNRR